MAKRFATAPIPKGETAKYSDNPFEGSIAGLAHYGKSDDMVVRPNDELLIQKGGAQAFNVYQKLLFDDTVQSAMAKLTQEVTAREFVLESAEDTPGDNAVKDFCELALNKLQLDEVYASMMEAYIVGFSVCEVMWRRTQYGIMPFDLRFRDQRRFRFQENEDADYGFEMRMATKEEPLLGIQLPARKFVVFRYWAQANGDPYGAGLGRILYPLVKFKRRALESQLLYSDRFANPTAVAKAPLSATTMEVETLYDHLSNLSQETALVMPEGFELEFVNPGGTPETFEKLRDSLIRDITLLIAGENEAGSQGAGSLASSEVAVSVRLARAKELCDTISYSLNDTLLRWIVDLNFGTNVEAPRISRDFEPKEDLSLDMAGVATLVKDVGLRPTTEWIANRFNVDFEEDDKVIPTGPKGTAGVDTMTDGGRTLDGQKDAPSNEGGGEETTDSEDEGDEVDLEREVDDALKPDDERENDKDTNRILRQLLGSDFSEANVQRVKSLLEGLNDV